MTQCKWKIADLYSGAGGAARGLQRAGFFVVGYDIKPQPRYAGDEFRLRDVMTITPDELRAEFDAVWASPVCHDYSKARRNGKGLTLNQIPPTRTLLELTGLPYIIENVEGSPLISPTKLCGQMFGLPIRRHRWFESNVLLLQPPHEKDKGHIYDGTLVPVWNGGSHYTIDRRPVPIETRRKSAMEQAMGIDWMTKYEITQAVPPAYSEFLGKQLIKLLETASV